MRISLSRLSKSPGVERHTCDGLEKGRPDMTWMTEQWNLRDTAGDFWRDLNTPSARWPRLRG